MRRTRAFITTMTVTALLSACGGGSDSAPAAEETRTSHTCKVFVAQKAGGNYKADASDPDAAKAEEAAWTAVCATLPEADRPNCRDEKKFRPQKMSASMSAGGPTTHTVTIELIPEIPEFNGEGSSEESKEKACAAATEAACAKAGEQGDCLAAGKFEKKGESTSTTRKKVKAA